MINKTISDYMNMKTERGTFVPVGSPLRDKPFSVLDKYGLKIQSYYIHGEVDNPREPNPNIEFQTGMHFQINGRRKDIKSFCEDYSVP